MDTNELKFKAVVDNAEIYNLETSIHLPGDVDVYFQNATTYIEFRADIDAKEWGIKCIDISIERIKGSLEWHVYSDELKPASIAALISIGGVEYRNGKIEGVIELDTNKKDDLFDFFSWSVVDDIEVTEHGRVAASNCEIDFKTKTITIT